MQTPNTPQEQQTETWTQAAYDAQQDALVILRSRVADVMAIENTQIDQQSSTVAFTGKLRLEAERAFDTLKTRFSELGYIPLLREAASGDQIVVAVKGTLQQAFKQRGWLAPVLFLATIATTTIFGGQYAASLATGRLAPITASTVLYYGVPFSLTLLTILGVHEFGHYVQAKRHQLPVTLPYFIPVPLGLGTFGAFIRMRGAVENKRALFDVGIGGPLAGLFVALPLFVIGLLIATLTNSPAPPTRSPLMEMLIALFRPEALDSGLMLNPVLLAARFGLVLTALNLLPVGQLDGGHIAYAALGRKWSVWIGYATLAVMAVLGATVSPNWFVWMAFAALSGVQHAPPLNDLTPLDLRRNVAFLATFVLLLSLFTAQPF